MRLPVLLRGEAVWACARKCVVIGWVCGRLGLEDCTVGTLSCKRTLLEMLRNRRGCKLSDNLAGMASLRLRGVRAGTVERESGRKLWRVRGAVGLVV